MRPQGSIKYLIALLLLASICFLGNAEAAKKPKSSAKKATDFDALIKKVMNEGWDHNLKSGLARALEVPDPSPGKELGVVEADSSDDKQHSVIIVLDTSTAEPTARWLVFGVGLSYLDKLERIDYTFRATASGVLDKAFLSVGKIDGKGHGVPGSARDDFKNINSREIKKLYQYELELWLEGKHQKQVTGLREKNAP